MNHEDDNKITTSSIRIQQAARAIAECDFLLVASGAGFSADSGLPTYTQVAQNPVYQQQQIDYSDLCRMDCLRKQPSLFYGFWGTCFNAYQEATPHEGYAILKQWCESKDTKKGKHHEDEADLSNSRSNYYHYTSNVDGYLRRVGFPKDLIHEMHGSIDTWLLLETPPGGASLPSSAAAYPTSSAESFQIVHPSPSFRFPVDSRTLELQQGVVTNLLLDEDNTISRTSATTPTAISNDSKPDLQFRPRVLMFDDDIDNHKAMGLHISSDRYQAWEEYMEMEMVAAAAVAADTSCSSSRTTRKRKKLVVLEIGCGVRVPSVRRECHDVIVDTTARCRQAAIRHANNNVEEQPASYYCTHIRINPEDFEILQEPNMTTEGFDHISIQGTALSTMVAIDKQMQLLSKDSL
jgi:hypothetical protein